MKRLLVFAVGVLELSVLVAFLGCSACIIGLAFNERTVLAIGFGSLAWLLLVGSFVMATEPRGRLTGKVTPHAKKRPPATESEVAHVEATLGVILPAPLRREMLSPRHTWGARIQDSPLTTDPDSLIEINQNYRDRVGDTTLLCVGTFEKYDFFVDLQSSEPIVMRTEHDGPPEIEYVYRAPLDEFIKDLYDDEVFTPIESGTFLQAARTWILVWIGILTISIIGAMIIHGCQTLFGLK